MPKRVQDPEAEHRLLAVAAARMRSEGLTQDKIAKRLDKSQPEVSRLVAYAQEHHYLARSPSFLGHNVAEADLKEVDRRWFVPERLRKALVASAPSGQYLDVRVLPDGEEPFSIAAAGCVGQLLRRAKLIGISWGRSVARVVSQIKGALDVKVASEEISEEESEEESDAPVGNDFAEIKCLPLCGDPVHLMNQRYVDYSASRLAQLLGAALRGQAANPNPRSELPCLVGVPAYLPQNVRRNAGSAWREFIEDIPGYREIFGPANGRGKPLVDRIDTIICGTGIIASEDEDLDLPGNPADIMFRARTGDFIRERLEQEEGLARSALAKMIYGDIGGWLLPRRHKLSVDDKRWVDSLNKGWTGIKGEHLSRVAREAKLNGPPGIILLAGGVGKAEMVAEIVRLGLVNSLLLDSSLAKALKRFLQR
ncbi:MAG TPA: hypothetical protein P5205_03055 [Candidatus Paceibacterota bacterium]|nr:hypothetical protein [Verrucomicrobiota bacterium]HSA09327.1 hypothetical protein [Candidatus Paceibacterota bacterium]